MKSMTKITKALFWIWLIVPLIFTVVGNVGALEASVPRPVDPVSWWPGDGNADDRMNNNPGTAENGTTYGDGKVGQPIPNCLSYFRLERLLLYSEIGFLDLHGR